MQIATQMLEVRVGCSLGMKNGLAWDGGWEEEEMEEGIEYNGERWSSIVQNLISHVRTLF